MDLDVLDIGFEVLLNFRQEVADVLFLPLNHDLDPAIRQIFDPAVETHGSGDVLDRETESHALDHSGIINMGLSGHDRRMACCLGLRGNHHLRNRMVNGYSKFTPLLTLTAAVMTKTRFKIMSPMSKGIPMTIKMSNPAARA